MNEDKLKEKLQEAAENGKISCTAARRVAEEVGAPLNKVGKACDELKIKIHSCELGCF